MPTFNILPESFRPGMLKDKMIENIKEITKDQQFKIEV